MAYRRPIANQFFDQTYYRYGSFTRLRYASLSDPERIERLRWRMLTRIHDVLLPQCKAAFARVMELGEAFIPREGDPKRIYRTEDGDGIGSDDEFWEREPTRLVGNGPLSELAEIGAIKEWEEVELPRRRARVTPEKLSAGVAFDKSQTAIGVAWSRVSRLNTILEASIRELEFIPACEDRGYHEREVSVRINGRGYKFRQMGSYVQANVNLWPRPDEHVVELPRFKIDSSLIGHRMSTVRARHGEPSMIFATHKRDTVGNIWIYGSVGVRFDNRTHAADKILTPKEVMRLLRSHAKA